MLCFLLSFGCVCLLGSSMSPEVARPSFDWCNYFAALLSAALVGGAAGAAASALMAPFMPSAPIVPSEMAPLAILAFLLKNAGFMIGVFFFFLTPSGVIAFVATLVFGSITLLLVRRTRLYSVATFALAGGAMGMMPLVLSIASPRFNAREAAFGIIFGLAGLAAGWAFGYRICFPVAMTCGPRPIPANERRRDGLVRVLLAR